MSEAPDLALQTGLRALPAMHGPMGMAAMASPTLRDAMRVFASFTNTRTRVFLTEMEETPDTITLHLKFAYPLDDAIRFLTESAMGSAYACHVVLRGKPIEDGTASFNYPAPAWAESYKKIFRGTEVVFDAPGVSLSLPARYGDEVLASHDRDLLWLAIQQCEARQEALRKQGTVTDQVLALLHQSQGQASLDAVADRLHMSPRTLIRKLKAEGTSFQELLDDVRRELAAWYLLETSLPVERIAEKLGYQDPSNFSRTFQRWFGTTPLRMRRAP